MWYSISGLPAEGFSNVLLELQNFNSGRKCSLTVRKEIQGPGNHLRYRAMTKKIWEVHCTFPRDLVYVVMSDVNPEALVECDFFGKSKRPK